MVIQEAPEDDVRRSDIAERLINACISFLHRRTEALPTTEAMGDTYPIVTGPMVGAEGIFGGLVIAFFEDQRTYSGRASNIYGSDKWKQMIFIKVDDLSTPRQIMYSLQNARTRSTLRHEIQHVLDRIRRKKKTVFTGASQKSNADDGFEKYYNSPSELNAYFHNVAEPLLERIRFVQKHGIELEGLFGHVSMDFREWFTTRIASLPATEASFWKWLSDQNKRKVIKRLEKLHALYVKLNAASKAKYSEETEEIDV